MCAPAVWERGGGASWHPPTVCVYLQHTQVCWCLSVSIFPQAVLFVMLCYASLWARGVVLSFEGCCGPKPFQWSLGCEATGWHVLPAGCSSSHCDASSSSHTRLHVAAFKGPSHMACYPRCITHFGGDFPLSSSCRSAAVCADSDAQYLALFLAFAPRHLLCLNHWQFCCRTWRMVYKYMCSSLCPVKVVQGSWLSVPQQVASVSWKWQKCDVCGSHQACNRSG